MSSWTHNICPSCWRKREGDQRIPYRVSFMLPAETCCFCGAKNTDGIYVRHSPAELRCRGEHDQ